MKKKSYPEVHFAPKSLFAHRKASFRHCRRGIISKGKQHGLHATRRSPSGSFTLLISHLN